VNDEQLVTDAGVVRSVLARAHEGLVDRELLVEAIALCAVAGEHLLVVGPPGTAKSQAVRSVAQLLGGRYFEYLLGRFSEPSEIFGPVDLRRLREGVVEVSTDGMLPEADIAFLVEVFLGSTAILNTLLGLLNERVYRRGSTARRVPLRVCVGATNTLPEEPALAAFADRFLARVFVEPIPDALLEDLLRAGVGTAAQHLDPESGREPATDPTADGPASREGLAALDRLAGAARQVDLVGLREPVATAIRRVRAAGLVITDRRAVRLMRLIAAAAVLDGRRTATADDLWVLPLIAPTLDAQRTTQDLLADVMADARSATLPHAADHLARGRTARAQRLTSTATRLVGELAGAPATADERLRIEATLREIDATFDGADLPGPLRDVRAQLVALVT
jgi:MoxR-like ATPase